MATLVAVRSPETCDSCSAQAYWRFTKGEDAGMRLCFCGHHATQRMRALQDAGFTPAVMVVRYPVEESVIPD